jgi:hypothetical protein
MGGTIFLPGTHTPATHAQVDRDAMLASSPTVVGLLGAGDASLYDSRVFHLGGANDAVGGSTRAIFYFSFLNPHAAADEVVPGSLRPDLKARSVTLRQLRDALMTLDEEAVPEYDPFCDAEERARTMAACQLSAAHGEPSAQLELGLCYRRGEGVERDDAETVRWLRLAAAQGAALAHTHLGHCLAGGHGVEQDVEEAARCYGLAAAQNEADAQYSLGVCYAQGLGVRRDVERALGLHMEAAAQGHFGAKAAYDEILRTQRSTRIGCVRGAVLMKPVRADVPCPVLWGG